jgi:hypothetical protein
MKHVPGRDILVTTSAEQFSASGSKRVADELLREHYGSDGRIVVDVQVRGNSGYDRRGLCQFGLQPRRDVQ